MIPVTKFKASHGISSVASKKSFSIVNEVSRSESLNSYLMFHPRGLNFLLSWILAWKNEKANNNFLHTSGFELSSMKS